MEIGGGVALRAESAYTKPESRRRSRERWIYQWSRSEGAPIHTNPIATAGTAEVLLM